MHSIAPPDGVGRVRSFVAIELGDPARPAVEAYLAGLRAIVADVAWTRPENLHLTLKFLGDVDTARLDALAARLAAIVTQQPPFTMTVAGVGGFPSFKRPRVLWVGVSAGALEPLAAAVDAACAAEGFPLETRPFHPHVTLGRVRSDRGDPRGRRSHSRRRDRGTPRPDAAAALAARCAPDRDLRFGDAPAVALVLFRSRLSPDGARYEPLAHLPFGSAAPVRYS